MWSKLIWPKSDAKMTASLCSKEYASTLCDLFFYLIVLKGCYLNIKSNAQTPFRRTYSRFFNKNWDGKLLSKHRDFFFMESIHGGNFSYTRQCNLVRTNYNTLVGSTTCKCKCFCLFIMLYNKFEWLDIYCGVVDVLGKLLRTWRIHY